MQVTECCNLFFFILLMVFFQIINILATIPPIYYLSDQPVEIFRIAVFTAIVTVTILTAQSFGFMLGTMLPIRVS